MGTIIIIAAALALTQTIEACQHLPIGTIHAEEFIQLPSTKLKGSVLLPEMPPNACFPESRTHIIVGRPVCFIAGSVPVSSVAVTIPTEGRPVELFHYTMRGDVSDVMAVTSYLDSKYERATEEYLTTQRHIHFFGPVEAWKDEESFYVLYQHEPGYSQLHRSLFLSYGTGEELERASVDLNTCK